MCSLNFSFDIIIDCSLGVINFLNSGNKFESHGSKRRAESECEAGAACSTKPGQSLGSMTPEALQLKEFKQKVKTLGIELRDAKTREIKLTKENERFSTFI